METQATQFLTQFSARVFEQWTQTSNKEKFWLNATFLQNLLEEAVAKLPQIPLKGHLRRELTQSSAQLKSLLAKQYVQFEHTATKKQHSKHAHHQELLNETDVERTLATTATRAQSHALAEILALDDHEQHEELHSTAEVIEALAKQLQIVVARRAEAPTEHLRKRGYYLQQIAANVTKLVTSWTSKHDHQHAINWDCSTTEDAAIKDLERVRSVLQSVAVQDMATASSSNWWTSSFYCPQQSALYKQIDYEAELAKIYGTLLALAIYFPVVQSEKDEATSDESSSSSDDEDVPQASAKAKRSKPVSCMEQAQQTARRVLFAAKQHQSTSPLWLLNVLAFMHSLPKPTTYLSSDDSSEKTLSVSQQKELQNALADVYGRAFTPFAALLDYSSVSDLQIVQVMDCLRHAVQFMRHERRQTIPALTNAMAHSVCVQLPTSFWQWISHAKSIKHTTSSVDLRLLARDLNKRRLNFKADGLLRESDVSLDEMDAILSVCARAYCLHLAS